MVRQLGLVAVRALLQLRRADGEMGAALALAGMRHATLRNAHGRLLLLSRIGSSPEPASR